MFMSLICQVKRRERERRLDFSGNLFQGRFDCFADEVARDNVGGPLNDWVRVDETRADHDFLSPSGAHENRPDSSLAE